MKGLHNSPDYFRRLRKKLFVMIQQFNPPTFFIIFTFVKRLWDPFIKVLHALHASKLNIPNKIEDLQSICITKLIRIDLVTCVRYYDHNIFFCKLITKVHYLFGYILYFFSSLNSKIVGVNMTTNFYG